MTRIVAGAAGSLTLQVPKRGTRPTSDRVREAIFSALDARDLVHGARVLDLYAGSGALGLEAASRGASHIALVERGPEAARVCRQNAAVVRKALGRDIPIDVHAASVQAFLGGKSAVASEVISRNPSTIPGAADADAGVSAAGPSTSPLSDATMPTAHANATALGAWDIVFIDPPYDVPEDEVTAVLAALVPLVSEDAVIVVERSSRTPQPTLPEGFELARRKDYGETLLWWVEPS